MGGNYGTSHYSSVSVFLSSLNKGRLYIMYSTRLSYFEKRYASLTGSTNYFQKKTRFHQLDIFWITPEETGFNLASWVRVVKTALKSTSSIIQTKYFNQRHLYLHGRLGSTNDKLFIALFSKINPRIRNSEKK